MCVNLKFYPPMHPVFILSSTTNKMRIAFGSATSTNGQSVNDIFHPGPNVYPEIPDLVLWFRMYKVGMSAHI